MYYFLIKCYDIPVNGLNQLQISNAYMPYGILYCSCEFNTYEINF